MLEGKHKGILSLNLKKLANRVDDLRIILILQNEMLLFMLICKRVLCKREKKLTDLLKELKASETISETDYKKLKPRGSSFGDLYCLCKTHKKVLNNCPPFRPILSASKTLSHNLAKFLVPLIEPIRKNNSFEFSKEICEQNFTNIPLEEIIKIYCDSLYKNQELLPNISKN